MRSAGAAVPEETGQAVGVVQGVVEGPPVTLLWGFSLLLPAAQTRKALFLIGNPPFPRGQHVIERIPADTRSDGLHPLLLLLRAGRRDAVHHVVALHYPAVRLCLTGFDDLPFVAGVVQLETVGFPRVLHLPDAQVLQRDDSPGLLIRRVFKVIEAVVGEDEPAPLPGLHAPP